ncbi:MAG TPA: hypothetical protein VJR93_06905 [Chthoniobacterales bacterium]|nr:hypothetical protein [Chthoniobacterales bacterium]
MPFDKLKYPAELLEERRKAIQKSVRPIGVDELTKIAREHDDEFVNNPARDELQRLVAEHPHGSFFHALAQPDVEILYCRDADFGIWLVPGSGIGALDETGKNAMKEAIKGGGRK